MAENRRLMKGNEALAEAALRCGCRQYFGYPITPQSEIGAYLAKRMPEVNGVFLQAESEIAAIQMVYGAAAAGGRAMTSTSSPGMSLKAEGISYIAGSKLPAVIVNVQRAGPGLGGIQGSQGDYWQATKAAGHGDFHSIVLAPASVQEIIELTQWAFELAEKYRTPVIILMDAMLGQMMEPVIFPEKQAEKAEFRVLNDIDEQWACNGHNNRRKNHIINSLILDPIELERHVLGLFKSYKEIERVCRRSQKHFTDDAEIILIGYGSVSRVLYSGVLAARENGLKIGMFRPATLWPFPKEELMELCNQDATKIFLCVEMSMGQMIEDVKLAIECKKSVEFYGRVGGNIPEEADILRRICEINKNI